MAFSSAPTNPDSDPHPAPDPAPERSPVPGTPTRHNWLALASFLLSFSPLIVWVVVFAFGSVFFPPIPARDNFYAVSSSYYNGYFATAFGAGLVSFVGSLSAVVTSSMARDWAMRFPGQPAWEDLAQGGRVLGIIGLVAVFVVVPCTFFGVAGQNYHGG